MANFFLTSTGITFTNRILVYYNACHLILNILYVAILLEELIVENASFHKNRSMLFSALPSILQYLFLPRQSTIFRSHPFFTIT